MTTPLFIPKTIHVGFQKRADTFTGKLAYVIYEDEKGILRKQKSWDGWRDQTIEPVILENKPQSHMVFNKSIHRQSYHFGNGRNTFRIYDPRDFEFEIDSNNLIGILLHSDVLKREIEQECVYAWNGKDLVLLPTNSVQYQESVVHTEKQDKPKLSARSLVKGQMYERKKSADIYTYIGYYDWYEWGNYRCYHSQEHKGKRHVWHNDKSGFEALGVELFVESDNGQNTNYSNLVEQLETKTFHLVPFAKIEAPSEIEPVTLVDGYYGKQIPPMYKPNESGSGFWRIGEIKVYENNQCVRPTFYLRFYKIESGGFTIQPRGVWGINGLRSLFSLLKCNPQHYQYDNSTIQAEYNYPSSEQYTVNATDIIDELQRLGFVQSLNILSGDGKVCVTVKP